MEYQDIEIFVKYWIAHQAATYRDCDIDKGTHENRVTTIRKIDIMALRGGSR